ncbi:MAG: hypothetical protein ACUVRD_07595 [Bacteroidia bacterium]
MCPVPFYLPLPGIDLPPFKPEALPSLSENLRALIFPLWDKSFFREDIELWVYTFYSHRPELEIWFDITDVPIEFYFVRDWFGHGAFRYKAGDWEVYKTHTPDPQIVMAFENWRRKHARLNFS